MEADTTSDLRVGGSNPSGRATTKSLAVKYNNPGCVRFSNWQRVYGGVPGINDFAKFSTYGLGKQAQLRLLRSAMMGRMVPYYTPTMTIDNLSGLTPHRRPRSKS